MDKNDPRQVPDLSGLSMDQFQEAAWREFDQELHEEGKSWTIMKWANTFDRIQKQRGSSLNVPVVPYNLTWLIPTTEATNNNVPQNPLYKLTGFDQGQRKYKQQEYETTGYPKRKANSLKVGQLKRDKGRLEQN